jgi:Zn-dependent peptidase ImmA (M78 family)
VRKARALLESLIELKQEFSLPIHRIHISAGLRDSVADLAKQIRQDLQLDEVRQFDNLNNALEAYIEKVESLGVAIFQLSLTQDNLRGFSLVDETIPVIVIKRNEQASAKIFTLFHELGHIILNDGGICDINFNQNAQQIEKWCNAFAANLLIPTWELLNMEIVKKQISSGEKLWSKADLISLAKHFHVGPLVILRSLLEQKLTTIEFYQEKHLSWNKPSFGRAKEHEGRNIAKETIREKGRTYISLAFRAYDQNKIDLKDLSDFLGVKLSYIPKTRQLLSVI